MTHEWLNKKCFLGCNLQDIHTIIFDFDGIFTDNKVYSDAFGNELICCSKEDSYGLNIFKHFVNFTNWKLDFFILSTETNQVVKKRADKIGLSCYQGIDNKYEFIKKRFINLSKQKFSDGIIYLGNDLNDLVCIENFKYSYVPSDSHKLIIKKASKVSNYTGGNGFLRDFFEKLINLDSNIYKEIYGVK